VVTSELPVSNPAPRMKEASMRPAKPKIGETRYVEGRDGTRVPVVISGRETHTEWFQAWFTSPFPVLPGERSSGCPVASKKFTAECG